MRRPLFTAGLAAIIGFLTPVAASAAAQGSTTPPPKGRLILFAAVPELDGSGSPVTVSVRQGKTVGVTIGAVAQVSAPPRSAVRVLVGSGLNLPRTFSNCWYFTNGGSEGAWCSFEQVMEQGVAFAPAKFTVTAEAAAEPGSYDVSFAWAGAPATDSALEGLARGDAGSGITPVQGSGGTLTLVKTPKLAGASTSSDFAVTHVRVAEPELTDQGGAEPAGVVTTKPAAGGTRIPPVTRSPAGTATRVAAGSAQAAATAPSLTRLTPAAAAQAPGQPAGGAGGGAGGGLLASTGSRVSLGVAAGAFLVMIGAAVLSVSRRRRFTAE